MLQSKLFLEKSNKVVWRIGDTLFHARKQESIALKIKEIRSGWIKLARTPAMWPTKDFEAAPTVEDFNGFFLLLIVDNIIIIRIHKI